MTNSVPAPLLNTFRIAALLRLIGVGAALTAGYIMIERWMFSRWWMALLTSSILLVWLLPWPHLWREQQHRLLKIQLDVALVFAIFAPQLDLIQSLWSPYQEMMGSPLYQERIGWGIEQINDIHALGNVFVMVPVVLTSWRYGWRGMWASLTLTGFLYTCVAFILPPDAFTWRIYIIRGFVNLGVTLILAFTTYILASAEKREKAALAVANQKLAQQAATIEQLAISQERNRLARELHDTLAHSLSGTAVQLQAVRTLLKVDQEAATQELKLAQQQIKQGLQESRRAITALRASPLEELGLGAALRQKVKKMAEYAGITPHIHLDPMPPLPPLTEQTIYRVAEEALANAEKHAQMQNIFVALAHKQPEIILTVQDDGQGFALEQVSQAGHFGLLGLQERADLIGAELTIQSQLEVGTTIQLKANI